MLRLDIHDKLFRDAASVQSTYFGVLVNAAPISRSYYEEEYDPSVRCMDCKHNIRGSGYGSSRACRFSQRLAILPEEDFGTVYQLRLPATSIFGEARDGNLPMQAYARFLKEHDTPAVAVITQMYFDDDSPTPKLFFKPKRPLTEDELREAGDMINHVDTIRAITLEFTPFKSSKISPFAETDGFQSTKI